MIYLKLGLMFSLFSLFSCTGNTMSNVVVGNYELSIPRKHVDIIGNGGDSVQSEQGFDPTGGPALVVRWKPKDVMREVSGYQSHQNKNYLRVSIHVPPTMEKLDFWKSAYPYRDILRLTGSFKDGVVKATEPGEIGLYKVSRRVEAKNKWEVLNVKPSEDAVLPNLVEDFWLARCEDYQDGLGISCQTEFEYGGLYFYMKLAGSNLGLIEELKKFVVSEFNTWKK